MWSWTVSPQSSIRPWKPPSTACLGRPKGRHRASLTLASSALVCPNCGRSTTLDFVRKGHYPRTVLTLWGWLQLAVPRVEWACGCCPSVPFTLLAADERPWSDLDGAILECTALALILCSVGAVVELQTGQVVSIGTVQRRVARTAILAQHGMRQKLTTVPPVIILDALWGTYMAETGGENGTRRDGCARSSAR